MNGPEFKKLIEGKTKMCWFDLTSTKDSTDKIKTRRVKILEVSERFLTLRDYNRPHRIICEVSTIRRIRVYVGYDRKTGKERWQTIYKK